MKYGRWYLKEEVEVEASPLNPLHQSTWPSDADILLRACEAAKQNAVVTALIQNPVVAKAREVLIARGFEDFKSPYQRAAVAASFLGLSLVAILPTGGGKSLIYTLLAVGLANGLVVPVDVDAASSHTDKVDIIVFADPFCALSLCIGTLFCKWFNLSHNPP